MTRTHDPVGLPRSCLHYKDTFYRLCFHRHLCLRVFNYRLLIRPVQNIKCFNKKVNSEQWDTLFSQCPQWLAHVSNRFIYLACTKCKIFRSKERWLRSPHVLVSSVPTHTSCLMYDLGPLFPGFIDLPTSSLCLLLTENGTFA